MLFIIIMTYSERLLESEVHHSSISNFLRGINPLDQRSTQTSRVLERTKRKSSKNLSGTTIRCFSPSAAYSPTSMHQNVKDGMIPDGLIAEGNCKWPGRIEETRMPIERVHHLVI